MVTQQQPLPARIGATIEQIVARNSWITWAALFFSIAALILGVIIVVWIGRSGGADSFDSVGVGRDSLTNPIQSRVAQVIVGGDDTSICTGSFVDSTGALLTAVHCFQEPGVCDFDPVVGEYPLNSGYYMVEVMGINGTTDQYTFFADVVGWSGLSDVMLLRTQPFTKTDGSVISLVNQPHFHFGESWELQRGEPIAGMSFDYGFLAKLGHEGGVQSVQHDMGSSFAVTIDQVFFDGNVEPGASGSGIYNDKHELVLAPLTYGWMASGDDFSNVFSVSGTSSRVSGPLVARMLNPDTPPNGPAHNKYLIPSLGIETLGLASALDLYLDFDIGNLAATQTKGIQFYWLASQDFYDFLTTVVGDCGFPPYTVTPPSMLGAPLDVTISGTPIDPFTDFPGEGDGDNVVVLEAIELELDKGDWFYLGEQPGLETVSGMLARGHFWVGDQVRVRVRIWNIASPDDPTKNWIGIYRVTLQAVDPFWDTIEQTYYASYAAHIRVNVTGGARDDALKKTVMHLEPGYVLPHTLAGRRNSPRRIGGGAIVPAPPGVDIYTLPTLAEMYLKSRQRTVPNMLKRRGPRTGNAEKKKKTQRKAPAMARRPQMMRKTTTTTK
jgi:hypothetical protein